MKKIIAISVMLVLIAGAAFADTSVGGNFKAGTKLLSGKDGQDDAMAGGVGFKDAYTNINWAGDNAGGMMRLHSNGSGGNIADWTPNAFAFWWWKPVEQVRVQFGHNPDADWGHAQIAGWGFNAEPQSTVAVDKDSGDLAGGKKSVLGRTAAWWGGFGDLGLALSFYPTDTIEIDVGIPTAEKVASVLYANSKINFKVGIPDIGDVRLAAALNKADKDADQLVDVHLAFYLSAIENMGVEFGAAFKAAPNDKGKTESFQQIEAALGFRLVADDLTFKARAGFVNIKDNKQFGITILPSYKLDAFTFYFNAGFGMNLDNDTDKQEWFVNPYIRVPANAGSFYAGFKFFDNGDEKTAWSIPIGWNVYL